MIQLYRPVGVILIRDRCSYVVDDWKALTAGSMLYPEGNSMVNMMETSLAETMVSTGKNYFLQRPW